MLILFWSHRLLFVFFYTAAALRMQCKRCINHGNSVCLSVCLLHAGTVPKRMNIGSRGLHCEVDQTFWLVIMGGWAYDTVVGLVHVMLFRRTDTLMGACAPCVLPVYKEQFFEYTHFQSLFLQVND